MGCHAGRASLFDYHFFDGNLRDYPGRSWNSRLIRPTDPVAHDPPPSRISNSWQASSSDGFVGHDRTPNRRSVKAFSGGRLDRKPPNRSAAGREAARNAGRLHARAPRHQRMPRITASKRESMSSSVFSTRAK